MDGLWWVALVLGVVEGVTEFLPVSSTGHLILAGHALGFTGERAQTFEVAIQAGAMLAVLSMYRARITGLLHTGPGFAGARGWGLLALTSFPALALGFVARKAIKEHLFHPSTVAAALLVGAAGMLLAERVKWRERAENLDALTPRQALSVGLAQCLALWPGMSRSACTVVGGMVVGLPRKVAAEYSFLAALPIIGAATAYDVLKAVLAGTLSAADVPLFLVGGGAAWISAHVAIRGFVRFVSQHPLSAFAWYRVVLALVVLAFPDAFGG